MHGQRSARHLDDPIRPFAGLTVGQLLSLLLGAGAGFATYRLSARFPSPNGVVTELYIFLVIAVAAGFAGVGMLLAGGQGVRGRVHPLVGAATGAWPRAGSSVHHRPGAGSEPAQTTGSGSAFSRTAIGRGTPQ